MEIKIVTLRDNDDNVMYPRTLTSAVQDDNGNTLNEILESLESGTGSSGEETVQAVIDEHNVDTTSHSDLRVKTDIIKTDGSSTKFLAEDGTYYEDETATLIESAINAHNDSEESHADIREKLDLIRTTGSSNEFLAGDGLYYPISMSAETGVDKETVNALINNALENHSLDDTSHSDLREKTSLIKTDGESTEYLAGDGNYYAIDEVIADAHQTYIDEHNTDSTSHADLRAKIDIIQTSGSSTRYLSENGSYYDLPTSITQSDVDLAIENHNASTSTHADIRTSIASALTEANEYTDQQITNAQLSGVVLSDYYTMTEINTLLNNKANIATTYTKDEADEAITVATEPLALKTDLETAQTDLDILEETVVEAFDIETLPVDVEIQGRTLVNLLGRSGNAIYQQDWTNDSCTVSYSEGNMVVSIDAENGSLNKEIVVSSGARYIFITKKSGVATLGTFVNATDLLNLESDDYIIKAFETTSTSVTISISCTELATEGVFKYIRVYEITEDEYDTFDGITVEEIAQKYPYVDDVKCVVNPYMECGGSRVMFETKVYDGEIISRQNDGSYVKNSEWGELKVTGGDFALISSDTGVKVVEMIVDGENLPQNSHSDNSLLYGVNYKGDYIPYIDGTVDKIWTVSDDSHTYLRVSIPNAYSGWGDDYTPTEDEIKAFFLGWQMYSLDNSVYSIYNGTETKGWFKLWCGADSKSTLSDSSTYYVSETGVSVCPTTMNDKGYTPYRLIYKKESPTTEEVKVHGSLMVKDGVGIGVGSGLVLGEVINAYFYSSLGNWYINCNKELLSHRAYSYEKIIGSDKSIIPFTTRDVFTVTEGESQACISEEPLNPLTIDYIIYSPDTVTSYGYTLTTPQTTNEILEKTIVELARTNEKLSAENRELKNKIENLSIGSNPNLLINGDFKNAVNQRGESTYGQSGKYTIDRWRLLTALESEKINMTLNDGYITLSYGEDEPHSFYLSQYFDTDIMNVIKGNDVSISIKYRSDAIYRVSESLILDVSSDWNITSATVKGWESSYLIVQNYDGLSFTKGSIDIEWIKLELGDHATPFVPRAYSEELAICQRYYQKLDGYGFIGVAQTYNTSSAYANFNSLCGMRIDVPTYKITNTISLLTNLTADTVPITSISGSVCSHQGNTYAVINTDGALETNKTYLIFADSDSALELDAEIY